jgi:DNA excision repair protein ERCC-3
MNSQKPLIIQSDRTLMLEVGHPGYVECRDFLALFAELVKSPEFIHTYHTIVALECGSTGCVVQRDR